MRRQITAFLCTVSVSSSLWAQSASVTVDLGDGTLLEAVHIPSGTFRQGSPATEEGRQEDEALHEVSLTADFFLGRTPVTVAQFTAFVRDTGYRTEAERGKSGGFGFDGQRLLQKPAYNWRAPGFPQTPAHPVTLVTFEDAMAFVRWVGLRTGRDTRLPTEAQWERACRATTQSPYFSGATAKDALDIGWFRPNSPAGTQPVGQKGPNEFHLFDMSGNVFEWVADWYGPYSAGPVTDPVALQPKAGDTARRVLRGGAFTKEPKHGRCAARYANTPGSRNADNGFRVAFSESLGPTPSSSSSVSPVSPVSMPSGPRTSSKEPNSALVVLLLGSLAVFCLGVLGVLLFALIRWATTSRSQGVVVRPGPDGFWVHAPRARTGQRVHYQYTADGQHHEGDVQLQPGQDRQYVYTGAAPRNPRAIPVSQAVQTPQAPRAFSAPTADHDHPSPPTAFRGYPSAY
jgi:formylglycine-generating enzyme required for sulfatase activity